MGNELNAFEKYLFNGGEIHYHGEGGNVRSFVDMLEPQNIHVNRDAPDMYIQKGDTVVIVEHFEFDSYKATKKGSEHRQELARIRRKEDSLLPTEAGVRLHEEIQGVSSYENYLSNVTRSFNEHYAHIDLYIENLKKEGVITDSSTVKVLFFAEDVSPLGTVVIQQDDDASGIMMVTLSDCKEFLDLLSKSCRVDYVLACSSYNNEWLVWFIDQSELETYYDHVIEYSTLQFLHFKPQVISYKMLLPDNQLNEQSQKEISEIQ